MRLSLWSRFSRKTQHLILIVGGGSLSFALHATVTGNPKFYREWIMPSMRIMSAENAHKFSIKIAKLGLIPVLEKFEPGNLGCEVLGMKFSSPVGLAAGFDKDGEGISGLLNMGFSFVEIGSVTPVPQPGNEKPRVFRLTEDGAIINRYGFNSHGHATVHERLAQLNKPSGIIGVNLGKNKTSADSVGDYVQGVERFSDVADYMVINISSPNTPGLRDMQRQKQLENLIQKVVYARDKLPRRVPILVKIAPDLTGTDKVDIAAVVARPGSGIDGLVVSNTSVSRPASLRSAHKNQSGGLSGEPIKHLSTQVIKDMYILTHGRLPIIGVGGVSSGEDVYDKLRAGASLVQFYTVLAYHGPPIVNVIKKQLSHIIEEEGFTSVSEVIGADHKIPDEQKQTKTGI